MGGLTVMRALAARLPRESFVYLGDTARLPYGTKSGDTVTRYAVQASKALVTRGIKMLVVACNTASGVALPALQAALPELERRSVEPYLPGPYTLVVPNPARRFPWLTGPTPEAIGVRLPDLPPPARDLLDRVGVVCATSANVAGGPDPRRVEDVPAEIRAACGAVVDAGELPGVASTVIDLTGPEPRVLREGARPPQ